MTGWISMGPQRQSLTDRFWKYVVKSDGCWEWSGTKSRGYGVLTHAIDRAGVLAHRLSWMLHFGAIPAGLNVCHHCDNPPCVRPTHLFLGTHSDNHADMMQKS